jgi:hypothetical protein
MIAFLTFVKSPLFKYLMIALAVFGVFFGVYRAGANSVQKKWDLAKQEVKTQIEIQRVVQDKITYLTNTVYVDRIREVKVKGDTITKEVKIYVTKEDDAACTISGGAIRVLDAAVLNAVPGPTDETDRAPSGVDLSGLVENTTGNYTTCHVYKERALAWEQWAKEQKEKSK